MMKTVDVLGNSTKQCMSKGLKISFIILRNDKQGEDVSHFKSSLSYLGV